MISIRAAVTSDIAQLVALLQELFIIEKDFVFDPVKQTNGLNQLLNSDKGCILVVESANGNKVVGMCTIQTLISTAEGGQVGLLEDLVVAAGFRHQGIGSKLLDAAIAWSRHQGLKRLQLLADKNNMPALDFYQEQSWVKTDLICLRKTSFNQLLTKPLNSS